MAFYELVDYVENVETYLAKSLISSTPEHGAENFNKCLERSKLGSCVSFSVTNWKSRTRNTEKFLNQVSDYSYSLSRKKYL